MIRTNAAHVRRVLGSSKCTTWTTPQGWFDYLNLEFGFTLDPCCEHETAKCRKHYTPAEDGLARSWQDERVFMNPPYGRELTRWMKKAHQEARDNGALVVCFVPARVDTEWWHRYAVKASEIRFPKGRVRGAKHNWPFPLAIVIFRPGKSAAPRPSGVGPPTSCGPAASLRAAQKAVIHVG